LKDLGIPGMTVEEFWEDGDKYYNEFEYRKSLVIKQAHAKLLWPHNAQHYYDDHLLHISVSNIF
jgi:hypothetical protein